MKCICLHHCKRRLLSFEQAVAVIILQESCPSLHCDAPHTHSYLPTTTHPTAFPPLTVKAERTPRSERKRRDSFGMYDGYESCSEESTSSSSSEDSDDEVVPSIPASLPIIKNNGQVYTYPDGKAGMGERPNGNLHLPLSLPFSFFIVQSYQWKEFAKCTSDCVKMSHLFSHSYVRDVWNGGRAGCFLLQNEALLQRVVFKELFLQFQKGQHPGETTGEGFILLLLQGISVTLTSWLILMRFSGPLSGQTTNEKSKSFAETASNGKAGCLRPVPSKSTEPVQIKSWYAFTVQSCCWPAFIIHWL